MHANLKSLVTRAAAIALLFVSSLGAVPATDAGVVGGPQSTWTFVYPHDSDQYELYLRGGQPTWIRVSGDGSTDLDLFIYDEYGNLIDSDTDGTDECYASVTPRWTGTFRIVVRNLGSESNGYSIWTN